MYSVYDIQCTSYITSASYPAFLIVHVATFTFSGNVQNMKHGNLWGSVTFFRLKELQLDTF